jgi:structure-specific recognition protein 1
MPKAESTVSKPKKAPSAYMLYSNDHRESVKKSHPDAPPTEIMKVLGEKWKAVSGTEKKVMIKPF